MEGREITVVVFERREWMVWSWMGTSRWQSCWCVETILWLDVARVRGPIDIQDSERWSRLVDEIWPSKFVLQRRPSPRLIFSSTLGMYVLSCRSVRVAISIWWFNFVRKTNSNSSWTSREASTSSDSPALPVLVQRHSTCLHPIYYQPCILTTELSTVVRLYTVCPSRAFSCIIFVFKPAPSDGSSSPPPLLRWPGSPRSIFGNHNTFSTFPFDYISILFAFHSLLFTPRLQFLSLD